MLDINYDLLQSVKELKIILYLIKSRDNRDRKQTIFKLKVENLC